MLPTMPWQATLLVQLCATAAAAAFVFVLLRRQRRSFGTLEERATLRTLAFATSTLGTLRRGLSARSAHRVLRAIVTQTGVTAAALYDPSGPLAFQAAAGCSADRHQRHLEAESAAVLAAAATQRLQLWRVHGDVPLPSCRLHSGVVAPLLVGDRVVATLVIYHLEAPGPSALRIAGDLAELLATQLRLQQAEEQQAALTRSELRALRAQISPHFIYNTLTTIAAFIRVDPDRARDLLHEFADFTRRAFRDPATEFTTLADELVYVHQYLLFEQARFGERLTVRYGVDPEVLSTVVPTLVVQPLVENAVKHGIESDQGRGTIVISAEDQDDECWIEVRDDGAGIPEAVQPLEQPGALGNIDRRLRHSFGPGHGLDITSRPGGGTTVRIRVPKYRPGVKAS